jgi:hypothetical protein
VTLRSMLLSGLFVAGLWASAAATCVARSARPAGADFVAGHLFVSSADADGTGGANVYRYTLSNGVPAATPDHVYFLGSSGGALPAFTVDGDGVASFMMCCFGVDIYGREGNFDFGWTITQPFDDMAFPGMALDGGRVLVDYVALPSSLRRPRAASSACASERAPSSGIAVYGPYDRKNFDRPLLGCFPVDQGYPDFVGMAVAFDDVYFPNASKVDVYGPLSGRRSLLRTLSGPSFKGVRAAAIDTEGRLYTLDAQPYSYVAVYDAHASGQVKALRTIAFPSAQRWNGNIAVDSRFLYVGANQSVLVYPKGTSGRRPPLATLAVPNSQGTTEGPWIAIGP